MLQEFQKNRREKQSFRICRKLFNASDDIIEKRTFPNIFQYFNFTSPTVLTKQLYEIENKKENNELVNVIKSGLIDLKDKIKKMSEDEKETEKPDKLLEIVKEILEFNR